MKANGSLHRDQCSSSTSPVCPVLTLSPYSLLDTRDASRWKTPKLCPGEDPTASSRPLPYRLFGFPRGKSEPKSIPLPPEHFSCDCALSALKQWLLDEITRAVVRRYDR
ncbi:hypothetical protein KM043_008911 [Ampulex compressa]|nr:hypothetical protein KM043_008911 [Ampulex compressa]